MLITVFEWSKAWSVCACLNTEVLGSNPTKNMDACVYLFCVCVILCVGSGLETGWSPIQGILQFVYRIKKAEKGTRAKGLYSHGDIYDLCAWEIRWERRTLILSCGTDLYCRCPFHSYAAQKTCFICAVEESKSKPIHCQFARLFYGQLAYLTFLFSSWYAVS
jgi:hypothetical protein